MRRLTDEEWHYTDDLRRPEKGAMALSFVFWWCVAVVGAIVALVLAITIG